MQEPPKLFWSAAQLLRDTSDVVDHGPCPRCNAERKTAAHMPAVPAGIPDGYCELCYHYVLAGGRIVSDDTYERFELNTRILFKGSHEDCVNHAKHQKKGRI